MNKEITINDFSPHLFWDVNKERFDLMLYKEQMIAKVLEYGNWKDWTLLKDLYGLETIIFRYFNFYQEKNVPSIDWGIKTIKKNSNSYNFVVFSTSMNVTKEIVNFLTY